MQMKKNKNGHETKCSKINLYTIIDGLENFRVPDCNFRESLAKLEKSKILITCLKFTFGELSSKILFECSGNL